MDDAGQENGAGESSVMAAPLLDDDLVAFKSNGDRGVVSYSYYDPEQDDDDDGGNNTKLLPVLCVDGAVVYSDPADVTVVDRSYLWPGEIVASASGQVGVVTDSTTTLDLITAPNNNADPRSPTMVAARGVSPADVRRVREPSIGDYVVSGCRRWLGRVVEASVSVDVAFADGATCRVSGGAEGKLAALVPAAAGDPRRARPHTNTVFVPGQRVAPAVDCPYAFKSARWLDGARWRPREHVEGTVVRVGTGAVLVCWVASAELGVVKEELGRADAPPAWQREPSQLTVVGSTSEGCWSLGDRCFFRNPPPPAAIDDASSNSTTVPSGDEVGEYKDSESSSITAGDDDDHEEPCARDEPVKKQMRNKKILKPGRRRARRQRGEDQSVEIERPMIVSDTRTTVDVVWQDGTWQRGVPSASLAIFHVLHEHEFFPGQRVVISASSSSSIIDDDDNDDGDHQDSAETDDDKDDDTAGADAKDDDAAAASAGPAAKRYGVVRSLDVGDQTVRVSWLKTGGEVECEETVSAYDLQRVEYERDVFYGDFVVRQLRPLQDDEGGKETAADDLSWFGRAIDLCDDGRVHVKWGDGTTSKVLPHEVSTVEELSISGMQEEMGDWVANDAVDTDEEDDATAAMGDVTADNEGNADDSDGAAEVSSRTMMGQASTGVVQGLVQLATEAWSKGRRLFVGDSSEATTSGSEPAATENAIQLLSNNEGDGSDTVVVQDTDVDGSVCSEMEKAADTDVVPTCGNDDTFGFPQFEVVQTSPPDHHFLKDTEQGIGGGKKWIKRVQKEWKILENDLPDTIYVRAFEDRMDLLRVAMVGASGTPYQDGLFIFDLHLPPSYPAVPPQVHYRSFGLRLNPNLDSSGTVCLSLLDTFGGEGVELWSPAMSTILQVVVSIQGLVLTSQPFYNEHAYKAHLGTLTGARGEVVFVEDACLLSLRTVALLLRRPPAGFEQLVEGHFRRRGRFVIKACEAYLQKGCYVGTLGDDARVVKEEEGMRRTCSSAGFRLALAKFVPRLVEAFTKIGADGCEQFNRVLLSTLT
ncbi:hypothetical protein QOZ80_5BG0452540 [Eleusine coracana subsp. coracana]|nr:hypothetical protein QOZ80_5BG0452540 [Eleusine coracana subsp. coracana]